MCHLVGFPSQYPSELGPGGPTAQGEVKSGRDRRLGSERGLEGVLNLELCVLKQGSDLPRVGPHIHAALGLQLLCWATGLNTGNPSGVELGSGP